MAERPLFVPRDPPPRWWLWVLAVGLHVPLIWLLGAHVRGYDPDFARWLHESRPVMLAPALPPGALVYRPGRRTAARSASRPERTVASLPATSPAMAPPRAEPLALATPSATDTTTEAPQGGANTFLAPHYAGGKVWVQPLPMTPEEMANRLAGRPFAELADSAVARMIQEYLDKMADDQAQRGPALPSWTTKIGGKTVGLDSRWIYLGPIKVPTALLSLLPINLQGNPTQAEFNRRLSSMREDLFDAARRAATYDDFKKAVKALHEETERKREFQRNVRIPPSDSGHGG